MDDAITDAATHVDVTQTVPPKHQHVHRLCVVRVIILNAQLKYIFSIGHGGTSPY